MAAGGSLAETVDERKQQTERDEAASRQDGEDGRAGMDVLDGDVAPDGERAGADDLAHGGDKRERDNNQKGRQFPQRPLKRALQYGGEFVVLAPNREGAGKAPAKRVDGKYADRMKRKSCERDNA